MGLVFRFQYTAAPPIEAPQRCALLPGGQASVSLRRNTWAGNTYGERADPKGAVPPPLLLTGRDVIGL